MSSFSEVTTYRPDTMPSMGDGLFRQSSLLRLHDQLQGHAEVEQAMIGQIKVGRVRSTGHDVSVIVDDQITVLMPLSGSINCEIQNTTFQASANEALILSPNPRKTRVLASQRQRFEAIPLLLPLKHVQQQAEELGVSYVTRKHLGKFGLTLSPVNSPQNRHFLQLICILAEELSSDASPISTKSAQSWSYLLTEKLVTLLDESGVIKLPNVEGQKTANRHVFRAEDFMQEHFVDITTVADIARECEISVRSLEMAFKTVQAQSPMARLTDIRLDQARRTLCTDIVGAETVTQVALGCGFNHLGRFSIAYKRRFSEAPSETIRKR